MTDDDHAVRLRDAVRRAVERVRNHPDAPAPYHALDAVYDQAIRYHEAKARVEAYERLATDIENLQHVRMAVETGEPDDYVFVLYLVEVEDMNEDVITKAEADLAAIIKEINDA